MSPTARVRVLGLTAMVLLIGAPACSSSAEESATSIDRAAVDAMCLRVQEIQNGVVDAGNAMSSAEVSAEPVERAAILAGGLESMIGAVRQAELPTEPAVLVAGLAERRDRVVADAKAEAAEFRARWSEVATEDRGAAVQLIFVIGEKLMSEVEPRVAGDTPDELIEIARQTPSCRHVIQLPRPDE